MNTEGWRDRAVAMRVRTLWGVAGSTMLVVWGMLVANAAFGVNFIRSGAGSADWKMYLGIALGMTVFSLACTLFLIGRVRALYRDGVEVPARITKIKTFMGQPLARVWYSYAIDGAEITKAGPMDRALAERLEKNGGLVVLADPRRPGRHVIAN
jgi:hypothetical protein